MATNYDALAQYPRNPQLKTVTDALNADIDAISGSSLTLDGAFDNGKVIDGANSEANAFQAGATVTKLKIWDDGTDLNIKVSAGDAKFQAAGGDFDFADDNIITTGNINGAAITGSGAVTGGSLTDGTATISSGDITGAGAITGSGAITGGSLTDGTATLASGSFSSGAAMNFKVSGDSDDYLVVQTVSNVPTLGTAGACDLKITASSGEIDFDDENLTTTGTLDVGEVTVNNADVNITTDSKKLYIGANGNYIQSVGDDLQLYDVNLGTTVNLTSLAGGSLTDPDVSGDLTITDGKFLWTDAVDEIAGTWSFAGTTNDDIDWTSSVTTADVLSIAAADLTSGSAVKVSLDESNVSGGNYFEAYDSNGASTVWKVAEDGVTTIAGKAGDALVITLGNIQITNGDIDVDNGKIEVDTSVDETSYVKRNQAITTGPVVEIEEMSADADNACLLLDHNPTGDIDALKIETAGTGCGITIQPANVAGYGLEVIAPTGMTKPMLWGDGNTNTWVGAANVGMLQLQQSGTLANAAASMAYLDFDGTYATNGVGGCLYVDDAGTADGTNYSVYINSANVEALKVDAGAVVFDETLDVGGAMTVGANVAITIADNANTTGLTIDQNDVTNDKDGLLISQAGAGSALKIEGQEADSVGVTIQNAASATVSSLVVDGATAGWIGAASVGMVHLTSDGALADANANLLRTAYSGNAGGVSVNGNCAAFTDTGAASGTSYAVYIQSTNNEALWVDKGTCKFDEVTTHAAGLVTQISTADVANPPTQADMVGAFGAAATKGAGWIGIINDANGGANEYFVWSDGTNYWYVAGTVGA